MKGSATDKKDYDAIVVGSGPNGLAAAIVLQQQGLRVLLVEAKDTIGGGLRTAELTLPGFQHDICSAIHPMAAGSPFFKTLPLQQHGLEWVYPALAAAHPFDDGSAAVLSKSMEETAQGLGEDAHAYKKLMQPIVHDWPLLAPEILAPLHVPKHPLVMGKFGLKGLTSASWLAKNFSTRQAKGLFGGMAAHSIQPFTNLATSAIALVLMATGHTVDWPFPRGGSQKLAAALASLFVSLGGKIEVNFFVKSLQQLPSSSAVLFDVIPQQLLQIAGYQFSSLYKWQLERFRYGMGVYKIDWALDGPIPFAAEACRRAGTVHIGNTFEEIAWSERQAADGRLADKPFVLLAQQSLFDATRAPAGKHTAWAYCHVPNGSTADRTAVIEQQIERFAPGFQERILQRHVMNPAQMEAHNPNYIGGDISGGVNDLGQLFTRPALRWSPYKTPAKGLYICSSSTPPGGGVHGMCGYHAARKVLQEVFGIRPAPLVA